MQREAETNAQRYISIGGPVNGIMAEAYAAKAQILAEKAAAEKAKKAQRAAQRKRREKARKKALFKVSRAHKMITLLAESLATKSLPLHHEHVSFTPTGFLPFIALANQKEHRINMHGTHMHDILQERGITRIIHLFFSATWINHMALVEL